jgi:protein-L-isoaspartate(D-aspartate) O-methyltransferase
MPDFAQQRRNMVEAQVRADGVRDERLLEAMLTVPRERFIPAARSALAYADVPAEVAPRRFLLDPRSFAKLAELAAIRAEDRILDVGMATGYSSAVLAKLGSRVIALEQDADLVRIASDSLQRTDARNATVMQGGLAEGAKAEAPFDVIFVNGAIEAEPQRLLAQLAEGGRLVAVIQTGVLGRAHLFIRENGTISVKPGFDASVPALAGFRASAGFVF